MVSPLSRGCGRSGRRSRPLTCWSGAVEQLWTPQEVALAHPHSAALCISLKWLRQMTGSTFVWLSIWLLVNPYKFLLVYLVSQHVLWEDVSQICYLFWSVIVRMGAGLCRNDKYIYWICHSSWQWWMTAWVHHARTMGCAMIVLLDMSVSVVRVLLEYTAVIQVIIYVVMPSKNVIMDVEHWFLYRINKTDFLRCLHTIFITSCSRSSGVSQHHSTSSEPKPFPGPTCQPDLWGWRKPSSAVPVVQRWNRDSGSFSPLSLP